MNETAYGGLTEPPEGVTSGESIPRENEQHQIEEAEIERVANALKARPRWRQRSEQKRRQKALELLAAAEEDE